MKFLRRLANIAMTMLLVAVLAYSIHAAATGQMPDEDRTTMIGGAVFVAAIMLVIVFSKFRRRAEPDLKMINDPNAVIQISLPPIESRAFIAMFLFAAVGCAIMLYGGSLEGVDEVWAWAGVILFAGLPIGLMLRRQRVSLRLSPEGLEYTVFGTGPIAWHDIHAATIKTMGRVNCIALDLRNPQEYLARRPKSFWHLLERLPLAKPFTFSPPSMGVSPESIVRAIEIRLSAFGRSGSGRGTLE